MEKNEQEQRQSDRDQALKRLEMEQERERMKLSQEEKLEFKKLQLERTKIESEKELKTHGIEIQVKATSTSHTKPGNTPFIKLPKLELTRFDRNILKWQEFWDSFDATINNNPSLQDVDKLSYLKGLLKNDAKDVISGLESTGNNYEVAVHLLKERYGRKELMINTHYSQLRNLPIASMYYEKLRSKYDIEQHLRLLQALGENTEFNLMVSLIQSKLPRSILAKLEEYKKSDDPWTVKRLRIELKRYVAAQENSDRLFNLYRKSDSSKRTSKRKSYPSNDWKKHQKFEQHSTGAFAANERNNHRCYYCDQDR